MLIADVISSLRNKRDEFSLTDAKMGQFVVLAYADLCSRRDWSWLRREYTFFTRAPDTYVVDVTLDSRRVKLVSTTAVITPTLYDKIFYFPDTNRQFRITNIFGGITPGETYALLDHPWPDASAVSVAAKLIYDEYGLPTGSRNIQYAEVRSDQKIGKELHLITPQDAARSFYNPDGEPYRYSTYSRMQYPTPAGLATLTPTAPGAGERSLTGKFAYYFSLYCKVTGVEGPLSDGQTVSPAGQQVTIITTNIGRKGFGIRIYRSRNGETTPYYLTEAPDSTSLTYVDDRPDSEIGPQRVGESVPLRLKLDPVPNDNYEVTVLYTSAPSLANDTANNLLVPDTDLPTLIAGTEMFLLQQYDEDQRAGAAEQRYERGVRKMTSRDNQGRKPIAVSRRAQDRRGSFIFFNQG